jgi:hypothetical protein
VGDDRQYDLAAITDAQRHDHARRRPAHHEGLPHPGQIDRYGAPISQNRDCQIVNISLKPSGMTADLVCSGRMIGKGEVQASWSDGTHATGRIHFAGTMQAGPNTLPVEWTVDSSSVYKGPDCGSVQPMPMPAK